MEDRRSFLAKAGVGVAAAWTAPLVLSGPAHAAGTYQTPYLVSWAGAHDVPGGDLTITVGTGLNELDVQPGDFLLALVAHHVDNNHSYGVTGPGSFTLVGSQDATDPNAQQSGVSTHLYRHVVQPGDASYTFSLTVAPPASTAWTLVIAGYRAANSLDPGSTSAGVPSGGATITLPGPIQTSTQNLAVILLASENPVSPWTETPSGGFVQRILYNPNNSVPEIYVADWFANAIALPAETFTSAATNHPRAGWYTSLSPY